MPSSKLLFALFFPAQVYIFAGCVSNKNKVELSSNQYNLKKPLKLILGDALVEISGISFYPKDSSVFAISDETGLLYKIRLNKKFLTEEWKFDKKRDYEDVMQHDSSFFVLESNGNIETLNFSPRGDTVFNHRSIFPGDNKKKNEFESLYYDETYKGFVMICKDCEDDTYDFTTAWLYDPVKDDFTSSIFKIDLNAIAKQLKIARIKFRPSGAAINPLTKDVWVISSTNQIIVVMDRKGTIKDVYTLDPTIFNQPEGITFTPWGDLLIANEAGDKYASTTLLIFKPKK